MKLLATSGVLCALCAATLVLSCCGSSSQIQPNDIKDEINNEDLMMVPRENGVVEFAASRVARAAPDGRTCSLVRRSYVEEYEALFAREPRYFFSRGRAAGRGREVNLAAFCFGFSPSTIVVRKGEQVRILATSDDVPHGIRIEAYGIDVPVNKDEVKRIEFTADRAGDFSIRCSVYCGRGHHQMHARLIVEE